MVDRGALKYFTLCVRSYEEKLIVGRERDCGDSISEVEMSKNDSFDHVDNQSKPIHINADQSSPIRRKDKPGDIASVLKGQGRRHICRQIEQINFVADWTEQELIDLVGIIWRSFLSENQVTASEYNTTEVLELQVRHRSFWSVDEDIYFCHLLDSLAFFILLL